MKAILRRTLKHPLLYVFLFAVFSLTVRECYPFSNFPMYSKNSPRTWYLYLQDGEGNDIPVSKHFRITAPQIKKVYSAKRDQFLKENDLKNSELTSEHHRQLGEATLNYVYTLAIDPKSIDSIRLIYVELEIEEGDFQKQTRQIAVR